GDCAKEGEVCSWGKKCCDLDNFYCPMEFIPHCKKYKPYVPVTTSFNCAKEGEVCGWGSKCCHGLDCPLAFIPYCEKYRGRND
uniref:Tau-theraphotoxin-Hs1a n=1 Tax=Cyriopagopus schmidti TaxID=29017 RepID=UPI00106719C7|nr:Chain A, Tau-theraphotoxin-Hs1a [Cyriopagopus schmidti]